MKKPKTGLPCFLIEYTGRARYTLRRYRASDESDSKCTQNYGYHNAHSAVIAETQDDPAKDWHGSKPPEVAPDDPRWPAVCPCGFAFTDEDKRQVFAHPLYRRPDTGALMTLQEAPAGAMWDATWWPDKGADGHAWTVRLPDGSDWMTEQSANNCKCPENDAAHRCWKRSGEAPALTINPSIATPRWHGWLREGLLIPC